MYLSSSKPSFFRDSLAVSDLYSLLSANSFQNPFCSHYVSMQYLVLECNRKNIILTRINLHMLLMLSADSSSSLLDDVLVDLFECAILISVDKQSNLNLIRKNALSQIIPQVLLSDQKNYLFNYVLQFTQLWRFYDIATQVKSNFLINYVLEQVIFKFRELNQNQNLFTCSLVFFPTNQVFSYQTILLRPQSPYPASAGPHHQLLGHHVYVPRDVRSR